jgi:hypothetical protein
MCNLPDSEEWLQNRDEGSIALLIGLMEVVFFLFGLWSAFLFNRAFDPSLEKNYHNPLFRWFLAMVAIAAISKYFSVYIQRQIA